MGNQEPVAGRPLCGSSSCQHDVRGIDSSSTSFVQHCMPVVTTSEILYNY